MTAKFRLVPALALLAAGCSLLGGGDYQGSRAEEQQTETWEAGEVGRVVVQNVNGEVQVKTGLTATARITRYCTGRDRADAEANLDRVVVSVTVVAGVLTLQVQVPERDPRLFGADIEITVPPTTAVDLQTVSGGIVVTGINAAMQVETTTGNITTHGVRGNIAAASGNGALDIDMAELAAPHAVTLSSGRGDVRLTIPASSSAMFTLTAAGGEVAVTGFDGVFYTVNTPQNKVGVIGTGAGLITATSANGNVTLRAK